MSTIGHGVSVRWTELLADKEQHKHPDNPFASLLVVVAESIAEVFLVSLTGYILARKGIVTSNVRRSLNKLNVSLFTPALLFSKVAFSLTPDKLAELWIVPIGFIIVTVTSMAVAWVISKMFRLKRSQGAFAIACAAFPNSNSLPVALMQSLVVSVKELKWGNHDTKDEMLGRVLSYLVLFSTLGIIARWSFGVKLLSMADDPEPKPVISNAPLQSPEALGADEFAQLADGQQTPPQHRADSHTNPGAIQGQQHRKSSRKARHEVFPSFPNTPTHGDSESDGDLSSSTIGRSANNTPRRSHNSESESEDPEWGNTSSFRGSTKPARSASGRKMRRTWRKAAQFLSKRIWRPLKKVGAAIGSFMTVPLYAALFSLVVCCIPPLQRFLATLVPLKEALRQTGNCSIPLTLVVLGGFMHEEKPPEKASTKEIPSNKRKESMTRRRPLFNKRTSLRKSTAPARKGETRTVMVAILSRMLVTPALLLPLLWWFSLKESSVADDPVFIVTACLVLGSPPALTLAQITDAASGDAFERLISKTMLWAYAVITPPTTVLLVVIGLWIDKADNNH